MKLYKFIPVIIIILTSLNIIAFGHSGRTDSMGGHRDNRNVSGLGYYHYHHGMGPHLHPNGICPYTKASASSKSEKTDLLTYIIWGAVPSYLTGSYVVKLYRERKHKESITKQSSITENQRTSNITRIEEQNRGIDSTDSETTRCPKCGRVMYLRKGKYGKFYGCSNYPYCKGAKNIKVSVNRKRRY